MQITRLQKPEVNESTLMYRNPLGRKGGRNKIIVGVAMFAIAVALVAVGLIYMTAIEGGLGLAIVLMIGAALYIASGVFAVVEGENLRHRPYAVIIDGDNLILREKHAYIHLPLALMRRLTIDCHGIDAYLSVNQEGAYDILIKGDVLYYTVDGVQTALTSRNMRKIAFILNGLALGTEKDVNWGERYDALMQSEHVEKEGAASGINRALDHSAALSEESNDTGIDKEKAEDAEEALPEAHDGNDEK